MLTSRFVRIVMFCYALLFIGHRLFPVGLHYYVIWQAVGEGLDAGASVMDANGPSLTDELQQVVSKRVLNRAKEVGLPLDQEAINIFLTGTRLTVRVAWTEDVGFWSYSWTPRLQVMRETVVL